MPAHLILPALAGALCAALAVRLGYLWGRSRGFEAGAAAGYVIGRRAGELEQLRKLGALTRCLCEREPTDEG